MTIRYLDPRVGSLSYFGLHCCAMPCSTLFTSLVLVKQSRVVAILLQSGVTILKRLRCGPAVSDSWQDTDCFQVVFYANYFRFFQRALNKLYAEDFCLSGLG